MLVLFRHLVAVGMLARIVMVIRLMLRMHVQPPAGDGRFPRVQGRLRVGVGMHMAVMRKGKRGRGQSVGRGHVGSGRETVDGAGGAWIYGSTAAPQRSIVAIIECSVGHRIGLERAIADRSGKVVA